MKKNFEKFLLILLLSSMILPFIPLGAAQQPRIAAIPRFTTGSSGTTGNWDPTCYKVSPGDWFLGSALEALFSPPDQWDGDYANLVPVLATNWTWEYYEEEKNAAGFWPRDGMRKITLNLRPNVKFHDGSDWNATVAKWNIDRWIAVTGNLTGETPNEFNVLNARQNSFWLKADEHAPYETSYWNVSKFVNTWPQYDGMFTQDNPFKTGFWGYFPRFKNVTITNNLQSGGTIEVYTNDWGAGLPYFLYLNDMISMNAYKDYFGKPIYGYGDVAGYPQDATFQHLIGTGPYEFVEYDHVVLEGGSMTRFDGWWNASAQQADGWHMVTDVGVKIFPYSASGHSLRNTAMVVGEIEFSNDYTWEPLVYNDMIAAPDVRYIDRPVSAYGDNLILNCINETYIKLWSDNLWANSSVLGWYGWVADKEEGWSVGGVNRAFRKAVSYAFNYTSYTDVARAGRSIRSGGFVGVGHEFYNASIPIADTDLTIARQALLSDPFWGAQCAARNLGPTNTTQEWRNVAEGSNPIYELEHIWDASDVYVKPVLEESIKNIGVALDANPALQMVPDIYTTQTTYYTFPWFTFDSVTSLYYLQNVGVLGWLAAYYRSPGVIDRPWWYYGAASNWQPVADYPGAGPLFPLEAFYNTGFSYNESFDNLFDPATYSNISETQKIYNKMADWDQNFQYSRVYIGHNKLGHAINTDWDYSYKWGGFSYALVKYLGSVTPPIPGYSIGITIAFSLVAMLGIIYTIKRKRV
jgi:ABC-type transport system substrate-binding protein